MSADSIALEHADPEVHLEDVAFGPHPSFFECRFVSFDLGQFAQRPGFDLEDLSDQHPCRYGGPCHCRGETDPAEQAIEYEDEWPTCP
jgi:hypothetical protein